MGTASLWSTDMTVFGLEGFDISSITKKLNLSEFEFFCTAAKRWGIRPQRVHEDYNQYLWLDIIPFYVSDWVRLLGAQPSYAH